MFLSGSMIFLLLFASTSCKDKKEAKEELPLIVKTAIVEKQNDIKTIAYPAKIVARQEVNISFRIAGPIAKINVTEGQFVHKGDILAEMDERDYKIQLEATTAQYKQIKAEAERVIELYKRNSVPQNDYDKAVYGLQQITALFNAHTNALADTKLRAPFDGYVNKIVFKANETVAAGMPIIAMISSGKPQVSVDIPSKDYINSKYFNKFYCTVNVYPDRIFPLDLVNISKKANLNQLFNATLSFRNGEKELPVSGMSANVFIEYKYGSDTLMNIPVNAIFSENNKSYVWIVTGESTVTMREIEPIDFTRNGTAVIFKGLQEGERIVIAGVHSLDEGQKVRIMKESSKTNIGNLL